MMILMISQTIFLSRSSFPPLQLYPADDLFGYPFLVRDGYLLRRPHGTQQRWMLAMNDFLMSWFFYSPEEDIEKVQSSSFLSLL